MLKSIRSRLVMSYLLVILLAMAIASALAWSALDRAFLDVLRDNLLAQARRVAQTVEAGDMSEFNAEIQPIPYSQLANVQPGYHTRVIDSEGVVILGPPVTGVLTASTRSRPSPLTGYDELASNLGIARSGTRGGDVPSTELLARPEIQSALNGEPATEVRSYPQAAQRRILYAAHPIRAPRAIGVEEPAEGAVAGVVYIASPLPRLTLSLLPDYFGAQILGGLATALILSGLIGLLLARQLTRPLQRLTDASLAMARGEPPPPLPPARTLELQTVGDAFNTMNANLTAAYSALTAQTSQREAILNGLADSVLATDEVGQLILANPAASALLDAAPQPVHQAIRQTLDDGEPVATEITARNRAIELLTVLLQDKSGQITGVVAVGHDVTAYRQLDRLRTSFVSDVSHELRTPLTAIKGFIETLQDGAVDDPLARDRFLDTIAVETERLIRLTNDLLLLTRADAGRLDLRLVPTDLVAAIGRVIAQLGSRAHEKQIALAVDPPPSPALPPVMADVDRLHQVLVNLLDNALKFTPSGGQITVSVHRADEQVLCAIADTGPGIPEGEIPLLFERFYRGDPSRAHTEARGGAGLGLSIAKAIVDGHGGRIWIESKPGQGAAVTFALPLAT
jgi:two-component system phosphate regulon sensor histidine kinase PhoR